jgi:hypothetical protein
MEVGMKWVLIGIVALVIYFGKDNLFKDSGGSGKSGGGGGGSQTPPPPPSE